MRLFKQFTGNQLVTGDFSSSKLTLMVLTYLSNVVLAHVCGLFGYILLQKAKKCHPKY